jgi:hypothetical protein
MAVDELCAIGGHPRLHEAYTKKKWELVRAGHNSRTWLSMAKNEGACLKGDTFPSAQAKTLSAWLSEVLDSYSKSTVRRITCIKVGLVVSSKRELIVAATQSEFDSR